jgi:hypothetical protein
LLFAGTIIVVADGAAGQSVELFRMILKSKMGLSTLNAFWLYCFAHGKLFALKATYRATGPSQMNRFLPSPSL